MRRKSIQIRPGIRKYGTKSNYTLEQLEEAINKIRSGAMSRVDASKHYNIPPVFGRVVVAHKNRYMSCKDIQYRKGLKKTSVIPERWYYVYKRRHFIHGVGRFSEASLSLGSDGLYMKLSHYMSMLQKEIEDMDDMTVTCHVCNKEFASEMALTNHVRMEHFNVFATGHKLEWMNTVQTPETKPKSKTQTVDNELIKQRTEQLISSMVPTTVMSLANENVSYIIIKPTGTQITPHKPKPRKKKMRKSQNLLKKKVVKKRKKDLTKKKVAKEPAQPLDGPFECLQPTNAVDKPDLDGICHRIFFSCCEYSLHYRDEHTRRRKGNRCQVCEKPLSPEDENNAPYTCQVCGAGFLINKLLSEHMSTAHVKLKPFECEFCPKRFSQQGGLQQHRRMHTGDRPFPCPFCEKAFTQKSGRDQHLMVHTKVKPYRCIVCGKTFCQSVNLKQHMRTHTNISPFQCGICEKRFKQIRNLNCHLKNHSSANMTDEQREKYAELLSMIESHSGIVEVEIDGCRAEFIDEVEQMQSNGDESVIEEQVEITIDCET